MSARRRVAPSFWENNYEKVFVCFDFDCIDWMQRGVCKNKALIDSKKDLFSGGSVYAAGFRGHGLGLVI
jgi:hypothetical protein